MRHSSSRWSVLLSAVVLSLGFSVAAFGQFGKGVVTGTVTDPSGASVPGAQVTLTNDATDISKSVTTNSAGIYRFEFTNVGTYTLKVSAQSFATVEVQNVVVSVAQTVTQDIQMELARAAAQTITVEASGLQLVETDKAEVSGLVDRNTLATLPLEIRDPIAFVNLLPGAIPSALGNFEFNGSTRGSAVNGARGGMGNFLLDGFDNNDQGQGGRSHNTVGSMPGAITGVSPDAIQEFRVITNNFSAQYGRQAGFVADAVLRSGSNQLHGSAFEYNRVQALAAQDFFSNKSGVQDSLVRNQFGGSLGGPIIRDKTFFFGAVEIQRLRQDAPNVITSVTPEFINFVETGQFADFMESDPAGACMVLNGAACPGGFDNSRTLGPIAAELLSRFPAPVPTSNFSSRSAGVLRFFGFRPTYPVSLFGDADIRNETIFNQNRFNVKIDHNLSDTDRLSGVMSFDDFDSFDSSLGGDGYSPYFPSDVPSRAQNWGLTYTHTFSPTVLNEFKVGYLRHKAVFERAVAPEVPSIVTAFDPLGYSFGHTSAFPQGGVNNQFQYQDHLAITRGRHNLNMGFEYRRTRNGGVFDANVDGFFLPYDTENLLTDGWFGADGDQEIFGGDFLGGFYFAQVAVDPTTGGRPDSYRGFRANELGSYIQDDWKIHPHFTLNIGLRWDYFGVPHNFRPGFDSNFFFGPATVPIQTTSANPFFPINDPSYAREATAAFQQRDSDLWAKDKNNFGPRFGFAWDVGGNQKTVIRGGGGVFYDRIWNNLFENIRFNPPRFSFNTIGTFINGIPVSPSPTSGTSGFYAIPIDTALFADPAFASSTSPRHMDENLRTPYMEQVFFGIQRQVTGSMVAEVNYIGTFGHKLTGVVDLNTFPGRALYDDFGDPVFADGDLRPNTTISRDNARGNYWNSNYHALQVQVTKRMSQGLQFQTNYTWSKTLDYVSDAFQNRQGNDIYPLDTTNRSLDYGRADFDLRHRFVTSVLYELPVWKQNRWAGGWQVGSIVTLQTGLPFQIYNSDLDSNADGNFIDRPDYVGSGAIQDLIDHSSSPADNYIDSSAFDDPALDPNVNDGWWINGNLGRNVISSPGLAVVDFSLQKKFQITERVSLRLDVNFFNMFNRPNFGLIIGNLSDSAFGRSTNTFGSRIGQLAARIDF